MTMPTIQVLLDDVNNGGTFPYDITSFVRLPDGIEVTRGRGNEFEDIQPSTFNATLENTDGRFTLGSTVGSYGAALNTDRRIQYKVTANAVTTTRFTGYVQNWPAEWPDGGDTFAVAKITAVDRLASLSRKTLRSIIEEEILLDAPSAYYTLGEAAGATTAGDTSGNSAAPLAQTGTGAAVTFGTATGPATDSLTAASFSGGKYLNDALVPADASFIFAFASTDTVNNGNLLTQIDNFTSMQVTIRPSLGILTLGGAGTTIGTGAYNDGAVHVLGLRNVGHATYDVYIDGVLTNSGVVVTTPLVGSTTVQLGAFVGSMAHFAQWSTAPSAARFVAMSKAMITGFAGERSDQRIARLASYAGVTATALETGIDASVPFVDITGASPLAAIAEVDKAEGGTVFIRGDGTLVMQNRSHRALQTTPDLTMTNNEVDPTSTVVGDMQLMRNVVTASAGANGAIQVVASVTSRTMHGDYPDDLTGLLVATDELALNAAQWRVGKYAEPFLRMPDLAFDLVTLTPAQQASVMALEISDHIQITGMPAQAGSTTLDLLTEGWTETLTHDSWTWEANTSNWSTATAWVLGDATYGVLGTTTQLSY